MDTRGHRRQGGKVSKIVVCLSNFYKNVGVKNKDTILFTDQLHKYIHTLIDAP